LGTHLPDAVRVQQAQTGHRGRTDGPLYGIRRVLRGRADHLSTKARGRLEAELIAGDSDGEVTVAWTRHQMGGHPYFLRGRSLSSRSRCVAILFVSVTSGVSREQFDVRIFDGDAQSRA
jgi:hypothetical protein